MESKDHYLIKVEGHICRKRIGQLDEADVKLLENGRTLINLKSCDQSKLHSVLSRIRDLGLVLDQVQRIIGKG